MKKLKMMKLKGNLKDEKTKVFSVNENLFFFPSYLIWRLPHRGTQLDVQFRDFTFSQKHVLNAEARWKRLLTKLSAAEETKC